METIEHAIHLFTAGDISIGRAALLDALDREDFMRVLGERQIPIINHDPDLDADLAVLYETGT